MINEDALFQKSKIILRLTEGLTSMISEEDEVLQSNIQFMMENALTIPSKIAGAEAIDVYDLKMENAAIIRKAARELYVQAGNIKRSSKDNEEYADLLRAEIYAFKLLFREWVAGFDPWNYINDSWGLFNPPGIDPED